MSKKEDDQELSKEEIKKQLEEFFDGMDAEEFEQKIEILHVGRKEALKSWFRNFFMIPTLILWPFICDIFYCFRRLFQCIAPMFKSLYLALRGEVRGVSLLEFEKPNDTNSCD